MESIILFETNETHSKRERLGLWVRVCIPIPKDFIEKNQKGEVRARGKGLKSRFEGRPLKTPNPNPKP